MIKLSVLAAILTLALGAFVWSAYTSNKKLQGKYKGKLEKPYRARDEHVN